MTLQYIKITTVSLKSLRVVSIPNISTNQIIIKLAWLPRLLIVTHAVYPHLNGFNGKLNFCFLSQSHSNQNLKTKLRTFQWVSRVQNLRQGFLSYDRTNKHTDRQTEITTQAQYFLFCFLYTRNAEVTNAEEPQMNKISSKKFKQSDKAFQCWAFDFIRFSRLSKEILISFTSKLNIYFSYTIVFSCKFM